MDCQVMFSLWVKALVNCVSTTAPVTACISSSVDISWYCCCVVDKSSQARDIETAKTLASQWSDDE